MAKGTKTLIEDPTLNEFFNCENTVKIVKRFKQEFAEFIDENTPLDIIIPLQTGNRSEHRHNGVSIEELLLVALFRLQMFNTTVWHCEENDKAIKHLTNALKQLKARHDRRTKEGKEGTLIPN